MMIRLRIGLLLWNYTGLVGDYRGGLDEEWIEWEWVMEYLD